MPTPMIRQYKEIKKSVSDCLLFFRLGDFYELFFEDAHIAAPICGLTLTARHKQSDDPIPMCGVPYHAAGTYIQKLGEQGHKVAICDQVEPATPGKTLVERKVIRIITPGMPFDGLSVSSDMPHYLAACTESKSGWVLACMDVTNGEFWYAFPDDVALLTELITNLGVKECLCLSQKASELRSFSETLKALGCAIQWCDESFFNTEESKIRLKEHFGVTHLDAFFRETQQEATSACGALLKYVQLCEPGKNLSHLKACQHKSLSSSMILSRAAIESLELVASPTAQNQKLGLVQTMDGSRTPMGRRLLRKRVLSPLVEQGEIEKRLDAQALFVHAYDEIRHLLEGFSHAGDLERLYGKIALGHASPREVWQFAKGLQSAQRVLNELRSILPDVVSSHLEVAELGSHVLEVLVEEPPSTLKDGGVIKPHLDPELESAAHSTAHFKTWVSAYEVKLRQELNIPSLKVKFSRVFGHSIEVTKTHLQKVPATFVRKQTMSNGERFITDALKQAEERMLHAKTQQVAIEQRLFMSLLEHVLGCHAQLSQFFNHVAEVDMMSGLCDIIVRQKWCKPEVDQSLDLCIEEGFHPVVMQLLAGDGKTFVKNSVAQYGLKHPLWLISGPNMGGKSTFMRQMALAVILAQMGCFVPAKKARMGLVDRVFTRIGAADALTEGKSTFFLEMQETAHFLSQATSRSLVLIDELGRGTSTYDGLAIVWAVCDYMATVLKCRTFCATHFYELAELKRHFSEVALWHMGAHEKEDHIVFDYRLKMGFSERSYGVHVARLAGVNPKVVRRATKVLKHLESQGDGKQPALPMHSASIFDV